MPPLPSSSYTGSSGSATLVGVGADSLETISSASSGTPAAGSSASGQKLRSKSQGNLRKKRSKGALGLIRLGSSLSSSSLSAGVSASGHLSPPKTRVVNGTTEAGPGQIAYRRTYSSNSIKIREVEVTPASFTKMRMLGKGDVGKVYLVKEKKSEKLFAMKGTQY